MTAEDDVPPPPLRGRSVREADREGGRTTAHRPVANLTRTRAKTLRITMTDAERLLWSRLRAHRLAGLSFRRQAPIGPYIADFVCHECRLVIELDGGQHAGEREAASDAKRTQWLTHKGYRVLRFWNSDVTSRCDTVVQTILDEANRSLPPSRHSHEANDDLPLKGGGDTRRGSQS
ncbi:MAG TPA: endonuclease domain-containing protein [Xanthobacteraceae bacterium]|nr:endonuclease domain-containing protein [Xanthobacteraceae bacterium]